MTSTARRNLPHDRRAEKALPCRFVILVGARIHASAAGVLLLALLAAPGVVPDAISQTLTAADIGGPAAPGMASFGGAITVSSRGWDVNGTSDQFTFVYRSLTGDTTLVARVDSLQNVDPWAQAGLMIRESLAANANHAYVLASAGSGVVFRSRKSAKAGTNQAKPLSGGAPAWLKLERRGSTFTASLSADGVTWSGWPRRSCSSLSPCW